MVLGDTFARNLWELLMDSGIKPGPAGDVFEYAVDRLPAPEAREAAWRWFESDEV